MDITNLKTYLEVFRTRHFGKAAGNLFVTQSAVSARIRQLESKLGVQLFTRDRNNIQPTVAGQKFYSHAESILNAWNRAQLNIALEDDKRSHIVVAGIPSLWDILLSGWIAKVNRQFPDVVLSCEAQSQDALFRGLMEGTVDLGFAYEPPHQEFVSVKKIPINLVMVSSRPGMTAQQAVNNDYIYVDWGTSFATVHAGLFAEAPIPPLRIGLSHIALDLINNRGGSAYLPEKLVREGIKAGSLYNVAEAPTIRREAHAILREGCENEILIKELLKKCQFNSTSSK